MSIDIESFIEEVRKRPALYNTKCIAYSDKRIKTKMWIELCKIFTDNWEDLGEKQKLEKCIKLQKKWKNLRTCFKREYNNQKKMEQDESESKLKKKHKYIYFDHLQFLKEVVESKATSNDIPEIIELDSEQIKVEDIKIEEPEESEESEEPETSIDPIAVEPMQKQSLEKKKSHKRTYEESLLDILMQKKDEDKEIDEDKYFLLSLLPSFKKFDDDQKFIARTEIMHVMRQVLLSKKTPNVSRLTGDNI